MSKLHGSEPRRSRILWQIWKAVLPLFRNHPQGTGGKNPRKRKARKPRRKPAAPTSTMALPNVIVNTAQGAQETSAAVPQAVEETQGVVAADGHSDGVEEHPECNNHAEASARLQPPTGGTADDGGRSSCKGRNSWTRRQIRRRKLAQAKKKGLTPEAPTRGVVGAHQQERRTRNRGHAHTSHPLATRTNPPHNTTPRPDTTTRGRMPIIYRGGGRGRGRHGKLLAFHLLLAGFPSPLE